jgi:dipeptidyl-peptidase-3
VTNLKHLLNIAAFIQKFLDSENISAYNTRLFFNKSNNYQVRVASASKKEAKIFHFEGKEIEVVYGDYSPLMRRLSDYLLKAADYVANDTQKNMLLKYVESFNEGSIDAHIDGSRFWIKDKGPVVESYIGFIESYRYI